jgi:hypothetical protein
MDIRERDVEDLFYKYGHIREIDLKTPSRPPAYAFISFDDPRDAQEAIRGRWVIQESVCEPSSRYDVSSAPFSD